MCRALAALLLSALVLSVAPAAPLPKERLKPAPSVVGEWVIEKLNHQGSDQVEDPAKAPRYLFREDGTYSVFRGPHELYAAKYVTNQKTDPATIDLHPPSNAVGGTISGIYKIDGDALTICWSLRGKGRPTKFAGAADSDAVVWEFRRVKTD